MYTVGSLPPCLLFNSIIQNLKFGQAVLPIFPSPVAPVAPVAYHTPAAASRGLLGMS